MNKNAPKKNSWHSHDKHCACSACFGKHTKYIAYLEEQFHRGNTVVAAESQTTHREQECSKKRLVKSKVLDQMQFAVNAKTCKIQKIGTSWSV